MRNVEVIEDEKRVVCINVPEYINKTFNMYPGAVETIKIKFSNSLINVIIDRFGEGANVKKYDDKSFVLRTEAAISEGLVRWILTWGSEAKVLTPESLVEKIKEEAKKMYKLYSEDVL